MSNADYEALEQMADADHEIFIRQRTKALQEEMASHGKDGSMNDADYKTFEPQEKNSWVGYLEEARGALLPENHRFRQAYMVCEPTDSGPDDTDFVLMININADTFLNALVPIASADGEETLRAATALLSPLFLNFLRQNIEHKLDSIRGGFEFNKFKYRHINLKTFTEDLGYLRSTDPAKLLVGWYYDVVEGEWTLISGCPDGDDRTCLAHYLNKEIPRMLSVEAITSPMGSLLQHYRAKLTEAISTK